MQTLASGVAVARAARSFKLEGSNSFRFGSTVAGLKRRGTKITLGHLGYREAVRMKVPFSRYLVAIPCAIP